MSKATDSRQIRDFVRDKLGCTCPEEVFSAVHESVHSGVLASASRVFEIGGRLLVAVFVPGDWRDLSGRLEQIVDAGTHYRDQHGFNRFRLVVATDNAEAVNGLHSDFHSLPRADAKVHLHVIATRCLPFDEPA